jgi:hypothetical protein
MENNNSKPNGYEKILNHIIHVFNYDKEKAYRWWMAPNINLENKSPYQLAKEGKSKDLMKILRKCL